MPSRSSSMEVALSEASSTSTSSSPSPRPVVTSATDSPYTSWIHEAYLYVSNRYERIATGCPDPGQRDGREDDIPLTASPRPVRPVATAATRSPYPPSTRETLPLPPNRYERIATGSPDPGQRDRREDNIPTTASPRPVATAATRSSYLSWIHETYLLLPNRYERIATSSPGLGIGIIGYHLVQYHTDASPQFKSMAGFVPVCQRTASGVASPFASEFTGWRRKLATWPTLKHGVKERSHVWSW